MTSSFDQILERLTKVERQGNKARALCPAHPDRRPSLSLTYQPDKRKTLLHCHVGCKTDDVLKALGFTLADLYDEPTQKKTGKTLTAQQPPAVYDYCDEGGNLLSQVVRSPSKQFYQRRSDGKGGWIKKLDGVRRILYHLPEVLDAIQRGATVFLVEGEKDAEYLTTLGLTATTKPGGAKAKWLPGFTNSLIGAEVALLPDNDDPGLACMQDAARHLHGAGIACRLLRLPGLPEHGDVSDWLAQGGTREPLEALVSAAPRWTSEPHRGRPNKQDACAAWLERQLSAGAVLATTLEALAVALGHSKRTMTRARKVIGARYTKDSNGRSLVYLPGHGKPRVQGDSAKNPKTSDERNIAKNPQSANERNIAKNQAGDEMDCAKIPAYVESTLQRKSTESRGLDRVVESKECHQEEVREEEKVVETPPRCIRCYLYPALGTEESPRWCALCVARDRWNMQCWGYTPFMVSAYKITNGKKGSAPGRCSTYAGENYTILQVNEKERSTCQ